VREDFQSLKELMKETMCLQQGCRIERLSWCETDERATVYITLTKYKLYIKLNSSSLGKWWKNDIFSWFT